VHERRKRRCESGGDVKEQGRFFPRLRWTNGTYLSVSAASAVESVPMTSSGVQPPQSACCSTPSNLRVSSSGAGDLSRRGRSRSSSPIRPRISPPHGRGRADSGFAESRCSCASTRDRGVPAVFSKRAEPITLSAIIIRNPCCPVQECGLASVAGGSGHSKGDLG